MNKLELVQKAIELEWPVRLLNPLIGKFNPFLPEFRHSPYPFYQRLRQQAPVYYSRGLQGWILTRHRDIVGVLADARFSVERQHSDMFKKVNFLAALTPDLTDVLLHTLLMLDPPNHTRLRKLVSKAFTPRRVEQLRPRIENIVADLLDRLDGAAEIELVRDFAIPLPVIVIAEMLGVPATDRERLKAWSDTLAVLVDPMQATGGLAPIEKAFSELRDYLHQIIAARRVAPRDDLISALVAAEEAGDTLTEVELLSLVVLLLAAGNETTTNLIGNGVLALLAHPEQRRRFCEEPELARNAVEELLRYDSPVQLTDRMAKEDLEICGHRIRKGQLVASLLGAANRDPQQFADPDRLDLGRSDNAHLSFGHGVHFCLGSQLARLEAQVALPALLRRFPKLSRRESRIDWKRSIVLRGPLALRLATS